MRLPRVASLAALLLGTAVGLAAGCDNDLRDSHCEPDDGDDRCISSPDGAGPLIQEPACASPSAADPIPGNCGDVSFYGVYDFMRDETRGNCMASGCHGSQGTAALGIYFPGGQNRADTEEDDDFSGDDFCAAYEALTVQRGSVGRPYLTPDVDNGPDDTTNDALQSWMYCNVMGLPGGGFPMPKPGGVGHPQMADVVRDFILCGAPPPCDENDGT